MADHYSAGKISDAAWGSLAKVIRDMGQVPKADSKVSIDRTAQGATANFAEIVLSLDEAGTSLRSAEEAVSTTTGNATLTHIMDHRLVRGIDTVNREVKEWSDTNIDRYLWLHFNAKAAPDGTLDKAGQFYQDILNMVQRGVHDDPSKVNYQWAFVNGEDRKSVV